MRFFVLPSLFALPAMAAGAAVLQPQAVFFEKTPVAAERCVFLFCLLCASESVFCCLSYFAENPQAGTSTWKAIMMCPRFVVSLFFSSFAENP